MGKIRITHYNGSKTICEEEDYSKYRGSISSWEKIDEKLVKECEDVLDAVKD